MPEAVTELVEVRRINSNKAPVTSGMIWYDLPNMKKA